jgi:hypothetical protein
MAYHGCYASCAQNSLAGSKEKVAPSKADEAIEAAQEAENTEGLVGTTLSEIDRIIAGVVPKKETNEAATAENIEEASSDSKTFDLRHLGSQQLTKEHMSKSREFSIAGGYQPRSILFGGVDEEILGCIPDHAGAKIVILCQKALDSRP